MIVTVTLNPSVDIRFEVDQFERGGVFRARESQQTAGGKGLNVARVLKQLGAPVMAAGLLGGQNGNFIRDQLEKEGIEHRFVDISDQTRTCIAILEKDVQSEVLGPGPRVKEKEVKDFLGVFTGLIREAEVVCISGSLPRGTGPGIYRELVETAGEAGCLVLLDTSGEPLARGIEGGPYLVKPNLKEMEGLLGRELKEEGELIEGLREVSVRGARNVCLSLGERGALVWEAERAYEIKTPSVQALNPVGSGDAMLAGWAWSLFKGEEVEKAAVFASACGVSNAMEKRTGTINPSRLEEIASKLKPVPKSSVG